MFWVYVVFCFLLFGCQYQCDRLSGKTRLCNDLLCVEWDVKPYLPTHPLKSLWLPHLSLMVLGIVYS